VGTTVTVFLPRSHREPAPVAKPAAMAASARAGGASRGQVLLVEDDNDVAALTREMLGTLGFSVIHVSSGAAALGAMANGRHIDLVLSDVMMPGGMSGLDFARALRVRQPTLPIVLTTGYAEAAASMDGNEFSVLLKPYSLESLASAFGVHL
jgi:CheY-like chemotaxis protein